ncbi:cation diffusion facilitator family transporter [Enterococcus thailandicus]|uniref:cation diffusion facilitator family transporter n=1 Tax=Enterococcus thailandicus TaxID=417368 RepID=UPI0022EBA6FC|nr:cation diffusion facilitator family transporter [Enterococcus thailandicus]MDA3972483.1 cation diffusion facilitator family transporter [Enterococcus thailandicus]MDA3974979.1 cation diffusion facilitator family transporter [Enterococcus thailandicus]MDA3979943.1 cation diffusion facilitator family transporter [Enterococcus thailandicus]
MTEKTTSRERTKQGILAGVLGLISNLILFVSKFMIGILSGSVSIMADAINSLSDTASSALTLIGFKIAAKPADKEHPYGHERFEYISGLFVSIIISYVGFTFLESSFQKIIHPENVILTPVVFLVLVFSIVLKFIQGKMYSRIATKIDSNALRATSTDSYNDVFTTLAVLISAGIEWLTGWRIDGYIGFALALYILYSGGMMVRDFVYELMGSRPTTEEIEEMEDSLNNYDQILGYHDLLVHNYGPSKRFASVHIEVDDSLDLNQAHRIVDRIEKDFKERLAVDLVCHLDPVPVSNERYLAVLQTLSEIVATTAEGLKIHDFRVIKEGEILQFDVVVPQKCHFSDEKLEEIIREQVKQKIGKYQVEITFDHNYLL